MYELRDYQQECVDTVDRLPNGSKTVVAIATGLGKTVTAAHFKFNKRLLWLSHRDELVRQPEHYFTEQGYTFGIEKADEHEHGEDVVSASIQSLSRDNRLSSFDPDAFDVIICDEAHHAAAPSYKKVLSYFHANKLVGLTATPQRGDKVRLDDVFDDICFSRDLRWGIENRYLSRIRCIRVQSSFKMNELEKVGGDYTVSSIADALKKSDSDLVVTKAYLEHCLPEKRQTVIYCPTIEVCKIVQHTLVNSLPKSEKKTVKLLSQECTPEERHDIIEGFRAKKYHCIINCMILTEGTDLPDISAIINNRPSANSTLYQQIAGRGTRLAEGKDYCLMIDVVGENSAAREICTAPSLFGVDAEFLSPRLRKQMQNEDLLEFADAILAERAQTAKQLQLAVEMIDFFTQQKLDCITEGTNRAGSFKEIASNIAEIYRADLEKPVSEYDFGDIIVKREPSDPHYFRIQPSFNGRIYLSKPNMLGKTVMDVSVPECCVDFISEALPMDTAMHYVSGILQYIVPEHFAQKWSKKARSMLTDQPASEKQEKRIFHDYADQFADGFYTRGLSKLQASDLIDLKCDLKALDAEKKELIKSDEPKRKGTKKYEQWQKQQKAKKKEQAETTKARKARWTQTRPMLDDVIAKGKEKAEADAKRAAELSDGQTHTFQFLVDYSYFSNIGKEPSQKQLSFLSSLINEAERKGAVFNTDPLKYDLKMWHVGQVIGYMRQIKDKGMIVKGKKTSYDLAGFVKEIQKITEKSAKPDEVQCGFRINTKER